MLLKKILTLSIIASLIISGLFIITNQKIKHEPPIKTEVKRSYYDNSPSYRNFISFTNDELQLKEEVVQFKITFHQDDVVDVSSKMAVLYVDESITSVYGLLTDGEKPLLVPDCLWYVPERKYLIVTPRFHVSIGKFWLVKLFPNKVGLAENNSGHFEVSAGDSWYLTLAVPTPSERSYFSFNFTSLNNSMEVIQLTRHGNVGLYTPTYNQFLGKYYAIKLSVLGGGSICDVSKEITVKDGSVFYVWVAGHRKGTMMVYLPNGEEKQFDTKRFMAYSYLGNESGTWKVTVKGWSLYFRMLIVLLFLDIDPHCSAGYEE
jgi:hypothetical protein